MPFSHSPQWVYCTFSAWQLFLSFQIKTLKYHKVNQSAIYKIPVFKKIRENYIIFKSNNFNHCSHLVNGGWSRWQTQSMCSVTCGGGIKSSKRTCNNPSPANGGLFCSGLSTKIEPCNAHSCPGNFWLKQVFRKCLCVVLRICNVTKF